MKGDDPTTLFYVSLETDILYMEKTRKTNQNEAETSAKKKINYNMIIQFKTYIISKNPNIMTNTLLAPMQAYMLQYPSVQAPYLWFPNLTKS